MYPPPDEQVASEILEYLRSNKNLADILGLYREVYNIHRRHGKDTQSAPVQFPDCQGLAEGKPLLGNTTVQIPAAPLKKNVEEICTAAKGFMKASDFCFKAFFDHLLRGDAVYGFLGKAENLAVGNLAAFLVENGAPEDPGTLEILIFILRMAVRIFYREYAAKLQADPVFGLWEKGLCPVCGERPMLSLLRAEDGARILVCGLCCTRWEFYRSVCPDCGNSRQNKLRFFYMPDQEYRRVYVCDECKSYLKATVQKELGRQLIADLENSATLHLDFLARKEGYAVLGSAKENRLN